MNLEQKRRQILEELGYSDSEIKDILEKLADPAYLDEYGAFPWEEEGEEEEYFKRKWHKTVDESFYDMYKELNRIPTLQEFIETTGYSETSYYRARKKCISGLETEKKLKEKRKRYAMTKKNKRRR